MDKLGNITNKNEYLNALELYYSVLGNEMLNISVIKDFKNDFELEKIGISLNDIYSDLRNISL